MGNTILLADKSITIQKIVELTFSDENYQIKCVNDGQSALDAIPTVQPSLILADINLPVRSGYDVCLALRNDPSLSAFSRVPVILLAGIYETMDEDRARAVEQKVKEVGANDLLSKPFDPQVLTSKVKELIGEAPFSTSGIPEPDAFLAPPPSAGIFSEVPETPVPSMEAPPDLFAPQSTPAPPDDSERTMMLPSPMSFAGNIFAETPPVAEESIPEPEPVAEERTVRVEAVTPMSEPVFEMSDLESAPEPEIEEVAEPLMTEMPEPVGDAFSGREELVFSMDTQPGVVIAPPAAENPLDEAPLVAEPLPPVEEIPSFKMPMEEEAVPSGAGTEIAPPLSDFVAASDEPFGDVFAPAPAPQQWVPAAASEEDSPFGLPEPPPMPEPPPVPEPVVAESLPVSEGVPEPMEGRAVPEQAWAEMPSELMETPAPQLEPVEEAEGQAVLEEMTATPAPKPDFGEDTWSQARKIAEGPVEELFEAEPAQAEEAEELQADLSEAVVVPEPVAMPAPRPEEAYPPATAGGPVEITDELIDRIAARVVAKLSERVVSEIVWQVVPDLAEKMIRRELEKLHAGED